MVFCNSQSHIIGSCSSPSSNSFDQPKTRELVRMKPIQLFWLGFLPPLVGAVASIVTALTFHNEAISNYNWQCGRARLPSLSRIINLPMERIFWQFAILFHIPLRILEIAVGFQCYGGLCSAQCSWTGAYKLCRHLYVFMGSFQQIFLVALSVIGEREYIAYHVVFFYAYGGFSIAFFIVNVVCHSQSFFHLGPYGRIAYKIKIWVIILCILLVPVLFGSFMLYWRKCITIMYDVFAVSEYIDVTLTIVYHGCATFFAIRHSKLGFSVRKVPMIR